MHISGKDIFMILGFFGLTSWTAWKEFHDDYINQKLKQQEHDKIVKELVEGDLLNEQRKFNEKILKRLDTVSINYKDITHLIEVNKAQDAHIKELEEFNAKWGYEF